VSSQDLVLEAAIFSLLLSMNASGSKYIAISPSGMSLIKEIHEPN
jgi:hypothetical protein